MPKSSSLSAYFILFSKDIVRLPTALSRHLWLIVGTLFSKCPFLSRVCCWIYTLCGFENKPGCIITLFSFYRFIYKVLSKRKILHNCCIDFPQRYTHSLYFQLNISSFNIIFVRLFYSASNSYSVNHMYSCSVIPETIA